jgi:hypothetical protein
VRRPDATNNNRCIGRHLAQSTTRHGGLSLLYSSSLTTRSVSGGHRSSRISAAQLTTKMSISQLAAGTATAKNSSSPTTITTSRRIRQRQCLEHTGVDWQVRQEPWPAQHHISVHSKGNDDLRICTVNNKEGQAKLIHGSPRNYSGMQPNVLAEAPASTVACIQKNNMDRPRRDHTLVSYQGPDGEKQFWLVCVKEEAAEEEGGNHNQRTYIPSLILH